MANLSDLSNTETHIVDIDSDPLCLGTESTEADMARYQANLSELLSAEFGCSVEVRGSIGGKRWRCSTRDDIDERVRAIETGDEWLSLIG